MQNYQNQTDSTNYSNYQQNIQQSIENAVNFGNEINNSTNDETLATILDSSYQSDSNSQLFNNNSNNNLDFTQNSNSNFIYNDKYSSSLNSQLIVDEISQTSNCSSSQFDNSLSNNLSPSLNNSKQTIKINQLSQQQIENDDIQQQPTKSTKSSGLSKNKKNDHLKLYEIDDDPERKIFLDKLITFYEQNGNKLTCPNIAKKIVDIYRVYKLVKEKNGFVEVCRLNKWKEIAIECGFSITSTTAYSLRKHYMNYILDYDCKFNLNGIDPEILKKECENFNNKSKRTKKSTLANAANLTNQINQTGDLQQFVNNNNTYLQQQPIIQSSIQQQPVIQQQKQAQAQQQKQNVNSIYTANQSFNKQQTNIIYNQQQPQSQQQIIFNNNSNYDQQTHLQKNIYLEDQQQQYVNNSQISNDQMINFDQTAYSNQQSAQQQQPPSQQQLINQNFNNNNNNNNNNNVQYYSNYEIEAQSSLVYHPNSNQALQKSTNQQYYLDNNTDANNNTDMQLYVYNDQMQSYSNYNYQDNSNNDSPRISGNRVTNEQNFSSKAYHFTNTNQQQQQQFGYELQQLAAQLSNKSNNNYQYQNNSNRVHSSSQYMIENNLDAKQQYNQFENWQMNNNWNQNCLNYSQQIQQPAAVNNNSAQLLAIESPIQKTPIQQSFYNNNNLITHKPPFQLQQQQPHQIYYQANNFQSRYLQPYVIPPHQLSNHSHHLQTMQNHQAFSNQPNHPLNLKNFKLNEYQFPPGCVESKVPDHTIRQRPSLKDLSNLNMSEIICSLKSGLLLESTKAINLLSLCSNDSQIKLKQYHQLLPLLLEYANKFLSELFPDLFKNTNKRRLFKLNSNKHLSTNSNFLESNNNNSYLDLDTEQECYVKDDESNFILTSLHPKKKKLKDSELEELNDNIDNELNDYNKMNRTNKKQRKNLLLDDVEEEANSIEQDPLNTIENYDEDNNNKCIAIFIILRNLSFHNDNGPIMVNKELLTIISKLILYSHEHNEKKNRNTNLIINQQQTELTNNEIKKEFINLKDNDQLIRTNKEPWWINAFSQIQDCIFVILSNISTFINFEEYDEELCRPILEGLLHWVLCPSSVASDNFLSTSIKSNSPKRLSIESLAKLAIHESNVDLMLNTSPLNKCNDFKIYTRLVNLLNGNEDQIIRDYTLKLLFRLINSDSGVAITISKSSNIILQLITYLEQYEENKNQLSQEQQNIINNNSNNSSNNLNTLITIEMAKKAAICLSKLSKLKENKTKFFQYEQRLLRLISSQILENDLIIELSNVTFNSVNTDELLENQT